MSRVVTALMLFAPFAVLTACSSSTSQPAKKSEPILPFRRIANVHSATMVGWSADGARLFLAQHKTEGESRASVRSVEISTGELQAPLPILIDRYDPDMWGVEDIKEHPSGRLVIVMNGVIQRLENRPWQHTVAIAKSLDEISDFQLIDFLPKIKSLEHAATADRIRCRTHLMPQNRLRIGWFVDQDETRTGDVVVGFTDVDLYSGEMLDYCIVTRDDQASPPQSIAFSPTGTVVTMDRLLDGNPIFDFAKEIQTAVFLGDQFNPSVPSRELVTPHCHPEVHALWSDRSAIVVPGKQAGHTGLGSMEVDAIELAVIPLDGSEPRLLVSKKLRCQSYLISLPAFDPASGLIGVISIGMPSSDERTVWLDLFHIRGEPASDGRVDWHQRYRVSEHDFSDEPEFSSGMLSPILRFGPQGRLIVEHQLRRDQHYRTELLLVDAQKLYRDDVPRHASGNGVQ